jgi:flagellin-like hook-associated protein FlgL
MPIVLNTNSAATEATFNLSKANDNLRRSIARLSSGNRITKPTDDAGGLAVAYKLQSSVKRTEASLNNHQNALSFLQVQDGVLEAMGDIVDRMAELRTMAADVSKNAADVENYSKEFLELQDQLAQMKREKFNGVELFAVEEEWETMKGLNKAHLKVNGSYYVSGQTSIGTKETYEYFDHPDVTNRTNNEYDKYEFELYTNPSGVKEDGNIKLNIVNLQFMLGVKDPGAFGIDATQTSTGQNWYGSDNIFTGAEWKTAGFDDGSGAGTANDGIIDAGEVAAFEAANSGWDLTMTNEQAELLARRPDLDGADSTAKDNAISDAELTAAGYDVSTAAKKKAVLAELGVDADGDGLLDTTDDIATVTAPKLYNVDSNGLPTGDTISVATTVNLAGLNQPTLDPGDGTVHVTNNGTNYSDFINSDGYIKDITKISIEEFTNIIEKIADIRAENGAEQQRVNQSLSLQQNNLVNLEAAHGRIMDVDVALESTRLARHSVTVQASAAMVAQANQMTAVALTLLSN